MSSLPPDDAELTAEVVDGVVAGVSDRDGARRHASVTWLLKKTTSSELRDVDPGFSDSFYVMLFAGIEKCFKAARGQGAGLEPSEPCEMPPPSDKGISVAGGGKPPKFGTTTVAPAAMRAPGGPAGTGVVAGAGAGAGATSGAGAGASGQPAGGGGGVKRPLPPPAAVWTPASRPSGSPSGSAASMSRTGVPRAGPTQGPPLAGSGGGAAADHPTATMQQVAVLFTKLRKLPEFDEAKAAQAAPTSLLRLLSTEVWHTTEDSDIEFVKDVLYWVYVHHPPRRPQLRLVLGTALQTFAKSPRITNAVKIMLDLLYAILCGCTELTPSLMSLLTNVLLPLHATHAFLTELQALLQLYHERLVLCLLVYLKLRPTLVRDMVDYLVTNCWPGGTTSNSPKEILMLHGLEMLLEHTNSEGFDATFPQLLPLLAQCATSDNSRVNQRSLQLFSNPKIVEFLRPHTKRLVPALLPVLLRGGSLHWNATVNKMSRKVILVLQELDADAFTEVANHLLGDPADVCPGGNRHGVERAMAMCERMLPSTADELSPEEREALVLTEAPTLLPDLMFHDLAFGKELGSGSFSVVKYAKRIVKGASAATWPEFAVKVISTESIRRLGYEASVQRELAVLRVLTHPSLARLVASFRWGGNAYFVLEYGSRGDLHTQITSMGSLDENSTRFLIGEVIAALHAIHTAGFVYGDLKPENIVLTASGHAKLTDFGAVRACTDRGVAILEKSADAIKSLRDGDWRVKAGLPPRTAVVDIHGRALPEGSDGGGDGDGGDVVPPPEDNRLEGTAAYLAPEVVKGGTPNVASDCWALGCVVYQCLAGRPPVWAETEPEMLDRIVGFDIGASFPDDFPETAKDLVMQLLNPDHTKRLGCGADGVAAVMKHPFFEGLAGKVLHTQKPPPMAQGTVAPAPDASWTRRQNSMMWTPMPRKYDASAQRAKLAVIPETDVERMAPFVTGGLTTVPESH